VAATFGYSDVPVAELDPERIIDHFDDLFPAVRSLVKGAAA
jgi:phosphoglycolate phosphatase